MLAASIPAFFGVGSGSASNPVFSGSMDASIAAFIAAGNGSFTPADEGGTGQFTATHYVTADATGSGNGTVGSPYTLAQAMSLAQPGWRVEVAPGTYIGPNRGNNNTGSFSIATLGTQAQPIIFFARNYAALTSTGLSILQHSGTVQGSGCPVLAARGGHHFYGFYINEDQAPTYPDTGPVVCYSSQWNRFSYMRVNRGSNVWPVFENNHAAFRFEGNGCRNNFVTDNYIENYSGIGWDGSEQGVQVYGPTDSLAANYVGAITIENNVFYNCQYGATMKSIGGRLIEGGILFRRNLLFPSSFNVGGDPQAGGINFIGIGTQLGRNQVYQNIMVGGANLAMMSTHVYPCSQVDVVNNTCISMAAATEQNGVLCTRPDAGAIGSGWRVHNNIKTGAARFCMFRYDSADTALQSRSHNYSNGAASWAYHDSRPTLSTLAQWVAATDWDDFSSEANPLLVSSTWGSVDLGKLQAGSPCRNAGVDLLNLNGGGTSAACHIGAYSNDSVAIGIRPLT